MATIKYKGEDVSLKITNKTMMRFEISGGSFSDFSKSPISQSIKFVCSALDLKGDPIDHADDFGSMKEIADAIKDSLEESGFSADASEVDEGKQAG
jgi:hypothetical protein